MLNKCPCSGLETTVKLEWAIIIAVWSFGRFNRHLTVKPRFHQFHLCCQHKAGINQFNVQLNFCCTLAASNKNKAFSIRACILNLSISFPPLLFLVCCLFYKHTTPSPLYLHGSREDMQEHMAHHFHSACRGWALLGVSTPLSSLLLCSVQQQLLLSIQSHFSLLHMYPSGRAHTVHTQLACIAGWHSVPLPLSARRKNTAHCFYRNGPQRR